MFASSGLRSQRDAGKHGGLAAVAASVGDLQAKKHGLPSAALERASCGSVDTRGTLLILSPPIHSKILLLY